MPALNWDDFRIFLAVQRAGGLLGAARRLGVDHTTIARRLSALESALGAQLVERSPKGARLTPAGVALLDRTERIEAEAVAAGAEVGAIRADISGSVRLATPEAFGVWLVAPNVWRLREAHPALQIELVPESRRVSLSKREADLAVTLARPPQGRLVARKLGDYRLGLYASRRYLDRHGSVSTLRELPARPLVWYIDELIDVPELRFFDEVAAGAQTVFRSSSIAAQQAAVTAGLGFGLLHVFAARQDPQLVRVLPSAVDVERSYWLVMHPEQKTLPRIRVVTGFLEAVVRNGELARRTTATDDGAATG